jgi:nitroreductase
MDVLEAIRTRRSVGKVDGEVTEGDLRTLVEAALCAPNHKLTDPFRFIALRGEARARLGAAWAAIAARMTPPPGVEPDAFIAKEARKPLRAPLLLVAVTRVDADPVVAEEDAAATAAAIQNVLLAAHGLGLGAIWRTGAMVRAPAVAAHLGITENERIAGIVYLGRPAMAAPASLPRDVDRHLTLLE